MKHEDIDNWLDDRLHPGHHSNSQAFYDFNKEVNQQWVEEIDNILLVYRDMPLITVEEYTFTGRLVTLKSKMGVSNE